jgi:hypothetical protein
MIEHFLRGIKTIEPDIISMENVRGITKTQVFFDFVKQVKKMHNDLIISLIEIWLSFVWVFCGVDISPNLDAKKTNLFLFCGIP